MLQVKSITKQYTTGDFTQTALNGVSLSFRRSEFVAILGPSGSGKTTFLNILGGLDHYDSGDLVINGKSTENFKESEWDAYRNNSVGFVFQSYNLIGHLGIVDNVEMGMTLSGKSATKKRKRAVEVLEEVGLKDHIHKKPNQLSGGQMQRVAIARALANDPDIILADEPTGALDTQTSMQIMELIKKVAKDKLVIMVTHNAQLADKYADRIVRFEDGCVLSDSHPYEGIEKGTSYSLKRTSMGFFTALKLSGKNIATKKWRTSLTAFASSMGIIGIALILSLSNGFNKQITSFETDTMSGFPIQISQTATAVTLETMREQRKEMLADSENEYPNAQVVYPYDPSDDSRRHTNIFTKEYTDYIEAMDTSLLSGVSYTRLVNMNILKSDGKTASKVDTSLINFAAYPTKLGGNTGYLESSYDLLAGSYPSKMTDLILIVDRYNRLDTSILQALGLDASKEELNFEDMLGYQLKVILNDDFYREAGDYFVVNSASSNLMELYNDKNAITLTISGILRANANTKLEAISPGIAYSDALSQHFIENAQNSKIVAAQKATDYNVLTGEPFVGEKVSLTQGGKVGLGSLRNSGSSSTSGTVALTKENILSMLGADGTPFLITIYPKDFTAKEKVTEYLNAWNVGKSEEDSILYTDLAATFTSLSGSIMDAVTIVLIAFAAISLFVSLIMVGIITYISVLERTREIGVLRALGARKKDITRVFNAETFLVGMFSGLLGIGMGYLLTIPANSILYKLTDIKNIASLNPIHAFVLVGISVLLTMLGGLIPAKIAAKKDPVEALRAE